MWCGVLFCYSLFLSSLLSIPGYLHLYSFSYVAFFVLFFLVGGGGGVGSLFLISSFFCDSGRRCFCDGGITSVYLLIFLCHRNKKSGSI